MSDITLCPCEEHWIEIKNKNGSKYLLSSKGRIYSYKKQKLIGSIMKKSDYIRIGGNSGFFCNMLHRIVYRYFFQINIEDYDKNYNDICHQNGIRNHNCMCNLRIDSHKNNLNDELTLKKRKICMKGKNKKPKTQETKDILSKIAIDREKKYKCNSCNSKLMTKCSFYRHHKNCNN